MKLNRWIRTCLCAVVLLTFLCASALAKVPSYGPDFYYLDDANVLSEELEGEIFFCNKLLYDACGAQIVVVTVNTTGREAIDDFTNDLGNKWKVGDASKKNGFVLLLAIDDEDYYALPGPGLDSRFSAGTIKDYYDRYLETDFAAGNYEAGVRQFFEAVFTRIADIYNADVTVEDGIAAYEAYVAENGSSNGFGGYNGTRRNEARGTNDYRDTEDSGLGIGFLLVVVLIVVLIVALSKGSRARRRSAIVPPPPPPPIGVGGVGYRPTHRVYERPTVIVRPPRTSGWSSGWSSGSSSSSSRSSFGSSSSSRSSFGSSSSSRSSFGGGRSSGFGGARGGGGSFRGGGAGRGR